MSSQPTPPGLSPGFNEAFSFVAPEQSWTGTIYPESPEFQHMPRGFVIGLGEWACVGAIQRGLDDPAAFSIGTDARKKNAAS
jgi:fluoroacetyl-CoA thioesterase